MAVTIRKAVLGEIEKLVRLRLDFLNGDWGGLDPETATAIESQLRTFLEEHIENNDFFAIIAEEDGELAATAFFCISTMPANPTFMSGVKGTVLNVFTYPKFRKRGIAKAVMTEVIEEAKRRKVSGISLSATEQGRGLYEKLGFEPIHYAEMKLVLDGPNAQHR